jgi:hypothetical protein
MLATTELPEDRLVLILHGPPQLLVQIGQLEKVAIAAAQAGHHHPLQEQVGENGRVVPAAGLGLCVKDAAPVTHVVVEAEWHA